MHVPANALFMAFLFGIIANPTAETEAGTAVASHRWMRFLAAAVSLILLFKAWPLVAVEYLTERTRVAFRAGEYDEVVVFADRALQRERANADLPYLRGEAQFRLGIESEQAAEREAFLRKAIASFEEGLKMFPQDSRLWAALGRSYDQLRDFESAEKAFRQAFALEPGSADIYQAYGLHWQLQDQLPKANECFERARFLRGIATPQPPKKRPSNRPAEPTLPGMPVQSSPINPVQSAPVQPAAPPAAIPGETPPSGGPARPKPQKKPAFSTE
jgi:tetratricopeptide (TPR) repeat protein